MPFQVDFRLFVIADAIHKFIDQSDPLVKVGVLDGITVVGSSVVIDIGSETIALDHPFFSGNGQIDLHPFGEKLPAGTGHFESFFES